MKSLVCQRKYKIYLQQRLPLSRKRTIGEQNTQKVREMFRKFASSGSSKHLLRQKCSRVSRFHNTPPASYRTASYYTLKSILPRATSGGSLTSHASSARYTNTSVVHDSQSETALLYGEAPFKKILAANRGEIATRTMRGSAELGVRTAGIYSHEGKYLFSTDWNHG